MDLSEKTTIMVLKVEKESTMSGGKSSNKKRVKGKSKGLSRTIAKALSDRNVDKDGGTGRNGIKV